MVPQASYTLQLTQLSLILHSLFSTQPGYYNYTTLGSYQDLSAALPPSPGLAPRPLEPSPANFLVQRLSVSEKKKSFVLAPL